MAKTEKLQIRNRKKDPLLLSLEPWGEDYTLLKGEDIEIIAEDCDEQFYYSVDFDEYYAAVYAEGDNKAYPEVYKNGKELDCGYNREFSPHPILQNKIKRRKLHQITFLLAGIYNICWGLWVTFDPNWLFRFANMELPNYPDIFICLGMVVGLYGIVYLEIARRPERGFLLALVGFVGKVLGPIGMFYNIYLGTWKSSALIMNITNDFIWLIPFAIYLYDSWSFYKEDLFESE